MSIVLTVILAAIIAFMALRGRQQGAVATLLILLGWVVGILVIYFAAGPISEWLYTHFAASWAAGLVEEQLTPDNLALIARYPQAGIQTVLNSLPDILLGQAVDDAQAAAIAAQGDLANTITEQLLHAHIVGQIETMAAVVILTVCRIVFSALSNRARFRRAKKKRVIGLLLGAVEGLGAGFVYALLLLELTELRILSPFWLTNAVSRLLSVLSQINIFLM